MMISLNLTYQPQHPYNSPRESSVYAMQSANKNPFTKMVLENKKPTLLSICIPTYNRRERVLVLVRSILEVNGSFDIYVHVDGSTDGSLEALQKIEDERLILSFAPNQGKTTALLTAIKASKGIFIMSFDDDDSLYQEGLEKVLSCCQKDIPQDIGGFIFHLDDEKGNIVGTKFPVSRSNYIALRSDHGVTGDKKEVVRTEILKQVAYDPRGNYRRAPPSLSWARIALEYDALCFNESIGIKRYLAGGITAKIWSTKFNNAYPMYLVKQTHCAAYFQRRYSNFPHFIRSLIAMAFYGLISLKEIGR